MAMKVEVLESMTDYTAVASGNAPMSQQWIFSDGSNNLSFVASQFDATDRALQFFGSSFFPSSGLKMFAAPVNALTLTAGFYMTSPRSDGSIWDPWIKLVNASGAVQMQLVVNNVGKLVLYGEGGAVLATSHMNFGMTTIYRICMGLEITTPGSAVQVKFSVNGYVDPGLNITADFLDQTGSFAGIRLTSSTDYPGAGVSGNWKLLDLMVVTGESHDWGPVELVPGPPNVDIVQGWTRLSGADNFAMVDEEQANGDTDYNYTETLNAKDIFGFTDPEVPEKIILIGMVSWSKKEDSATRRFRHLLRVGGVDYAGVDIFSAESYGRNIDAWFQNPETVADWDPTDLAPLQFGYEYLGA